MLWKALDFGLDIAKEFLADERQDNAQAFNREMMQAGQAYNERAYRHRYQWQVEDLVKAGLNPMLAYMQSPGSSPTSPQASAPAPHNPSRTFSASQAAERMEHVETMRAQQKVMEAEARVKNAEEQEILARTPTHAANIDHIQQQIVESGQRIKESIERIEEIRQQVKTGQSSAAHLDQQVTNLKEMIPQIRATVDQLKGLTRLNEGQLKAALAQANVDTQRANEIIQRVRANLPALQAALMGIEKIHLDMETPGRANMERAQDSFMGQLGAYMRQIEPLQFLMGLGAGILGRSGNAPTPRDTRQHWNRR